MAACSKKDNMDDLNESVSLTSVDESQTEAVTNNPDVAKLKEAALARTKLIQEAEDPFSKMLELYDFSEDDTFHLETGDKDIDNIEYARVTLKDDSIGLLNITEKKKIFHVKHILKVLLIHQMVLNMKNIQMKKVKY